MELSGVETRECQKCIHQPPDMDVHSPGIPVERVVPHLLQEPPAGKSHAIVWHQVVKQVKLPRCRIDLTPLHSQHACFPRHQLPGLNGLVTKTIKAGPSSSTRPTALSLHIVPTKYEQNVKRVRRFQ